MYSGELDEVLTQSHLIIGKQLISPCCYIPTKVREGNEQTMHYRVKYLNLLMSYYETRWKKEYLTELREFIRIVTDYCETNKSWERHIEEEGLPRCRWKMGKVLKLLRSKDGYIQGCRLHVYNEN